MILSILTCTLPERAHLLKRLSDILTPQLKDNVEWLTDPRGRQVQTGRKRNELIHQSRGAWVCFIDDDDIISSNYVALILNALQQNPDCVTFEGWMTTNDRSRMDWVIKLGESYEERGGKYYRFPNHLCPIRKSIANQFSFPPIYQGEDYQWALAINNSGVLKTSVHIPEKIYHYDFRTNK